jgi:hypothetical protein
MPPKAGGKSRPGDKSQEAMKAQTRSHRAGLQVRSPFRAFPSDTTLIKLNTSLVPCRPYSPLSQTEDAAQCTNWSKSSGVYICYSGVSDGGGA